MFNRREFLTIAGSSAALLPLTLSSAIALTEQSSMHTRPIPSSGESLPVVGLGQSPAFRNGDQAVSKSLLDVLLAKGGGFVDTGPKGQQILGQFMSAQKAHDKLFLGSNIYSTEKDQILNEIRQAQQAQDQAALDLVWIRNLQDILQQWQNLLKWKEMGLTRYVGFAMSRRQYYEPIMKLMQTGTVDFVQVNYSILEREAAQSVLPVARDNGVAIVTNRPFVNGQYFKLVGGRELPAWAEDFDCHSWAQFSVKYILANMAVNCVLTETTKTKHALDNLSAGFGRLPDVATQKKMVNLIASFI
jgi:diketogulonate reductase-like aldo/keto reductase